MNDSVIVVVNPPTIDSSQMRSIRPLILIKRVNRGEIFSRKVQTLKYVIGGGLVLLCLLKNIAHTHSVKLTTPLDFYVQKESFISLTVRLRYFKEVKSVRC